MSEPARARRAAVIGSPQLFGLFQQHVVPVDSGAYQFAWGTGTPAVAELPLGAPG